LAFKSKLDGQYTLYKCKILSLQEIIAKDKALALSEGRVNIQKCRDWMIKNGCSLSAYLWHQLGFGSLCNVILLKTFI
jgi:hypothetical protein